MKIGGTIKRIRVGKNISQEELAENILSRPHLSLIENNKSDPSINMLIKLIDRLHISLDEFFYLANNYHISESKKLSLQLMNEANKANYIGLQSVRGIAAINYEENNSYEFYHILLLSDIYIKLLENNFTITEEIQNLSMPIKEYLFGLSDWYLYDLKLFNNILFVFSLSSVESIAYKLFNSINRYDNFPNAREEYLNLLINLSTFFIENKAFQLSLKFAKKGKLKSKNEYKIYENIVLDINIAISNVKLKKEIDNNIALLKNHMLLLDYLGLLELKEHYKKLLVKYKILI